MRLNPFLRSVLIALLAVGLLHGLPWVISLPLLLVVAWALINPQPAIQPRSTADRLLEEEQVRRIQRLEEELSERTTEAHAAGELRRLVKDREAQLLRMQTDLEASQASLQGAEALMEDAQGTIDQLKLQLNQIPSLGDSLSPAPLDPAAAQIHPPDPGALLLQSKERDLYPQERLELLITVLRLVTADPATARNGFTPSPRASHILDDLIACNSVGEGSRTFNRAIKNAFRSAETERKLRANLQNLGFTLIKAKGSCHNIISLRDDPRYSMQVSSTPGDNRSRNNEAQRLVWLFISKVTDPRRHPPN